MRPSRRTNGRGAGPDEKQSDARISWFESTSIRETSCIKLNAQSMKLSRNHAKNLTQGRKGSKAHRRKQTFDFRKAHILVTSLDLCCCFRSPQQLEIFASLPIGAFALTLPPEPEG